MAEYEQKLYDIEEIPCNDSLVAGGNVETGYIRLTAAGEYKRGEVLMSLRPESAYEKATLEGLKTASTQVCILAEDITLEEGDSASVWAYFTGRFNESSLVYDESIEIAEIESLLYWHEIYIR